MSVNDAIIRGARMAYDDVIAKFLYLFEVGRIDRRVSGSDLSNRFRSVKPFNENHAALARECLNILFRHSSGAEKYTRLNKATLLTWLLFVARLVAVGKSASATVEFSSSVFEFFLAFHRIRDAGDQHTSPSVSFSEILYALYTSRASFRVADSSSVIIRDLVLWVLFDRRYPQLKSSSVLPIDEQETLRATLKMLSSYVEGDRSAKFEDLAAEMPWGRLQ